MGNKINKSLTDLQKTPIQQLQMYSLVVSSSVASPAAADVSAITDPTALKSVGVSSATPTTSPLWDDESSDSSSCSGSLDFP